MLQSVADLSTPPKLPKFVRVCMHVCKSVCAYLDVYVLKCIKMPKEVHGLYQTNSFSHWHTFNNAEFVSPELQQQFHLPESDTISTVLAQTSIIWYKVQYRPAASWQQPAIDTDPFNFKGEKNSSLSENTQES